MNSEAQSLYRRVIGEPFERMPPAVRAIHGSTTGLRAVGTAEVRRGRNVLGRMIGAWLGVPRGADSVDLQFEIRVDGHEELWTRRFGDAVMRSRFHADRGVLYERLGPATLAYALEVGDGGLHTRLRGLRFLGLPMPHFLHPTMSALTSQDGERYRFDIEVQMPLIGLFVAYRGHLTPIGT